MTEAPNPKLQAPKTDVDHPEIPAIEWCFGAGGNHLGLRRVIPNLRLVALSEIEAYAAANVVAKMEAGSLDSAPNWTDCRTFPCELFTDRIALFIASYPCQGESHAGKRLGPKDPRWLWPAVRRGVEIMRPLRCFFENVEGHISKGLRAVCRDLEALGYRVACGIFSAEEVGAHHRRKRIFIMADAEGFDGSLFVRSREPGFDHVESGGRSEELANAGCMQFIGMVAATSRSMLGHYKRSPFSGRQLVARMRNEERESTSAGILP